MDKNGIHSFQESIKLSKKYNAYATNRANYLQAMGIHAKIKNADLTSKNLMTDGTFNSKN